MSELKVAFIGLGVIGYPLAGHLSNSGYDVTVINRTRAKAEKWADEHRGKVADQIENIDDDTNVVILCVGDDNDVRDVLLQDDSLRDLPQNATILDHTTGSAKLAREISEMAYRQKHGYVDAPVSGGGVGAKNGTLSIMAGGKQEDFDRVRPLLGCYGKAINLMGPAGSGQQTKMVNQICIAGALQGVAEALNFGINSGLDMDRVLSVISQGAAQSWQLENRGPWMLNKKYTEGGFAVNLMKKDLSLCLEEADLNSSQLPLTSEIYEEFKNLQEEGFGKWDFSSLFHLLSSD